MSKYCLIVNPTSGRGNGESSIPLIEAKLKELGLDFILERTQRPGHAIELAQQAAQAGAQVVVAAGGDGTANEVLNGLVRARLQGLPAPAMGLIPVGRGNDFGFGIGIPHDLSIACQALAADQRRSIDVGLAQGGDYPQGRYFGNGVGIGFDAVVGFEALKMKKLSGFPSYIVAALKTIFLYFKAPMLEIAFNDQAFTQSSLMVSVMNGRRMGGGFMMAPHAEHGDGQFDLCIVAQVSKPGIFALIPKFMQGTQEGHPAVRTARTQKITVTAIKGWLPAHADGETLCEKGQRLEISLLPQMLEVITLPPV